MSATPFPFSDERIEKARQRGLEEGGLKVAPEGTQLTCVALNHPITEGMTYGQQGDQYVCWECLTIAVAFREAPDQLVRHIAEQIEPDLFRSE